jgi:hypothetical protein
MKPILDTVTAVLLLALAQTAPAEVFVLTGGGRVTGELVNPNESPRRHYVVQVADGSKVTLEANQVKEVLRPRPNEAEYERIQPTYADTAAAQWELAQWCREHKLPAKREIHLRRVIELDPNHAEAHRALGHSQVEGRWNSRDDVMSQRGYVKYKGQWKLPQEIELLEGRRKLESNQQEWFQKLKRWRGWIGSDREEEACQNIRTIDDPVAIKALAMALHDDQAPPARLLYIEALGKIDTPEAAQALAIASLSDPVAEVRLTCLDQLQKKRRPEVIAYYVGKLSAKKSDNDMVNLAGFALGRMQDPSAIGPLIEALVTTHKFKIVKPGGDGATTSTFGTGPGGRGAPGGGGMSAGGGPTYVSQTMFNQAVLDALAAITGQNFNFDKQAWKFWYAAQKRPPDALDGRRD